MKALTFLAAIAAALQLCSSSALGSGDWTWPVRGPVITPYRNGSDPYAAGQHRGIDIGAAVGDPVVAATAGRVTFAGVAGSSGLTVSIRTADGRYDTSYLHLSSVSVRAGSSVSAGDRVGAVGTTGRRSAEQPHLHFGVRDAGKKQAYHDPLDFLAPLPAPTRPEPAPPHAAPVPAGDETPIPLPGLLAVRGPVVAGSAGPAGVRVPAPRSVLPGRAGLARPHGALAATPARRPGVRAAAPPARSRTAAHAPAHPAPGLASAPRRRPAPSRRVGLGPAPVHDQVHAARSAPWISTRPRGSRSRGHHGFDIGWLAACVGLVAAACALGRPDGVRGAAAVGRDAFGALLKPLGGRG